MAKVTKEKGTPTSLQELTEQLNAKYGAGSTVVGTSGLPKMEVVPTSVMGLNFATFLGGLPKGGKVIMIEGEKHVGKSTLTLEIIKSFQQQGLVCALYDFEFSFSRPYAEIIGVSVDDILCGFPESLEDGYNQIEIIVKSGLVSTIVIDSLSMMMPKAVLESQVGDATVAVAARLHSTAMLKLKSLLAKHNVNLIGITQYRANIGAMGAGNDKTTAGGAGWRFASDMMIKVSRFQTKKDDGYFLNKIEIIKNKCAQSYGVGWMHCFLGEGVDEVRDMMYYGKESGVVKLNGAYYSHGETKLGQGMEGVREFLNDNPEYKETLKQEIIKAVTEV